MSSTFNLGWKLNCPHGTQPEFCKKRKTALGSLVQQSMSTLRISSILILNNFDRMFHYKPSSYWGTTMAMETPKLEAPVTPEVATKTLLGDLKGLSQEGFTGLPLTSPKATRDSGNLPIFRRFPGQSEQFQTSPLILPLKVETSKLS